MDTITFRSITPLYNFDQGGTEEFTHSGTLNDANFSIRIKKYARFEADYNELMKYADQGTRESFVETVTRRTLVPFSHDYFLVVDVMHPFIDELKLLGNSLESLHVTTTAVDTLRLHSSKGIFYAGTYNFRSPPNPYGLGGGFLLFPQINQNPFNHLGYELSELNSTQFDDYKETFNALLNRKWNTTLTFDKVLLLALQYHKVTFELIFVEHSFLILMIVFEALFKKDSKDDASQASMLISKLLSSVQKDQKKINREFYNEPKSSFCKLRNKIAHGEPGLESEVVKSKYRALYTHVTNAFIKLLRIPVGRLDSGKDYYDEISNYIDTYFKGLPRSH